LENIFIFGYLEGTEEAIGAIWNVLDKRFCAIELTSEEYTGAAVGAFVIPEDKPVIEGEEPIKEGEEPKEKPTFAGWMKQQDITVEEGSELSLKESYDNFKIAEIAVRTTKLEDKISITPVNTVKVGK
jgi:hypothetical protein